MSQQRPVQIEDIDDEFARNVFAHMLSDPVLWQAGQASGVEDGFLSAKAMIVSTLRTLQYGSPSGFELFDSAIRRLIEGDTGQDT